MNDNPEPFGQEVPEHQFKTRFTPVYVTLPESAVPGPLLTVQLFA